MKTLVLYKSLTGFTKKYAEWIAEELQAELLNIKFLGEDILPKFDIIVFGGSLHATGISGVNIIKNMDKLSEKYIIIFAVGASPSNEGILKTVVDENFSVEEQSRIKFYYLRGGFDYKKLDFLHKIIMTLFKWKLSLIKNKTREIEDMLAAYSNPVDFTKKETIKCLVDYVNLIQRK